MEATTVAQKLITGIMCRHGAPERIISDRGLNFTSEVFKEVTSLLGMKYSKKYFTAWYAEPH